MMNVEDFACYVADEAYKILSDELDINMMQVRSSMKNNGTKTHFVTPTRQGDTVSPTIYLDNLYESYKDGKDIEDCVDELCEVVRKNIGKGQELKDVGKMFGDYEKAKENLKICVINTKLNKELLGEVPHVNVEDVSLVFRVIVESNEGMTGSVLVRNEHMEHWGIEVNQLYEDAKTIMNKRNDTVICSMMDILRDYIPSEELKSTEDRGFFKDEMYVISNRSKVFGASEPFYNPSILDKLGEEMGDLYVIPSSIHEVIVVSKELMSYEDASRLIQSVNDTEVEPEEVLSDHPYVYNAKTHELTMKDDKVEVESEAVSENVKEVNRKSRTH